MGMGKKVVLGGVGTLAAVGIMSAVVSGGGDAEAEGKKDSSASSNSSAGKKSDDSPLTSSTNQKNAPKDDIKLGDVTVDEVGWASVPVTITNHSSDTSDYTVEIEFLDAGGQRVDTATVMETKVAPGQVVNADGQGLKGVPADVTAKVISVDRYASL
ncbi:FxLYD domain-containing protein [Streptomyces endophyticus]|uniref:FxLYD domain-containing protein n=1 Tax=Streptomyces endophyticus TaxID=714166 RepID=A0ABU6FEX7_9ACTN|nr:FxLYD domain-containing protein [Streptomyces endophyticus]MEB8342595.1 FxLYD domain-containing protein [Streptomyces endophyticus]